MKIYTYYQNINHHNQDELVDLWRIGWSRQGYEPIVLNLQDAKKHPYFDTLDLKMREIFKEITTKQIGKYGMSCWFRWLAYATQVEEKCYVSDYDAINVNFSVKEPEDKLHLMDNACPFLASGTPKQFEDLCKAFVEVSTDRLDTLKVEASHYHDQEFFEYNFMPTYNSRAQELRDKYNILMTRDRREIGGQIDPVLNKVFAGPRLGYVESREYKVMHVSHHNIGNIQKKYKQYKHYNVPELRINLIKEILGLGDE